MGNCAWASKGEETVEGLLAGLQDRFARERKGSSKTPSLRREQTGLSHHLSRLPISGWLTRRVSPGRNYRPGMNDANSGCCMTLGVHRINNAFKCTMSRQHLDVFSLPYHLSSPLSLALLFVPASLPCNFFPVKTARVLQ